jgi:hypothetical protein
MAAGLISGRYEPRGLLFFGQTMLPKKQNGVIFKMVSRDLANITNRFQNTKQTLELVIEKPVSDKIVLP